MSEPAFKPPRARRAERFWSVLAIVLVLGGLAVVVLNRTWPRRAPEPITGEVLPELEPVDRIEAGPGAMRGFNVLIISCDTTRADHLACYGNRGIDTPVIDGLARNGVLCASAATPSPSTLPAHASLLTGLYPVHHGARANGTFRLGAEVTTLAERLRDAGYRTAAVISAFVLDGRFGLDQGFDLYDDDLTRGVRYSRHMFRERPAELTNESVTAWLDAHGDEPFFLWVHYFDPHAVYLPPEPFRTRYRHDPYDGEIAYVDSQVGVLLEHLRALGLCDRTLVVFAADHGEGMGEHGEQTHSLLIYDATLHVPLIFCAPSRLPRGKVLNRQTCLVDVAPTVLGLLGLDGAEQLDGIDLCAPPAAATRPVLIETIATMTLHGWAPLVGVRDERHKYILAPTPELYDLRADSRELENIHDRDPTTVRALADRLGQWLGADPFLATRQAIDLDRLEADAEVRRHLAALGYVGTVHGERDASAPMYDPKDMVPHWEKLQHAINLRAGGKPDEAFSILEECVAEVDGDVFARSVLAAAYLQRGDLDLAQETYERTIELEPNDESLHVGLATVHLARGQLSDAQRAVDRALDVEPQCAEAHVVRGRIAARRQDEPQAFSHFEQAIAMDPGGTGPSAHCEIGMLHLRARRLDEAREAFQAALDIDGLNGGAHTGLADILIEQGKPDEAARELALALRFDPIQPGALASLASLMSRRGEHDRAIELCQRALAIAPRFPQAHNNLGLAHRRLDDLDLAEAHYLKAIEYGPWLDAPHINLAQLYLRQGKADEGMEEFRRALLANPYCTIALANLGARHFNEGHLDQAFAFYQRALLIDPEYALVHRHIASIYALRDDPGQALDHLRRSLELDPGQADADELRQEIAGLEQERDAATGPEPPAP